MPRKRLYRFLGYQLDPERRVVERNGELLPMPPKMVDMLIVLVEHAGEVVDKNTLMHTVWPDTHVVDSSLTRNISLLRKALSEGGNGDAVIQTVSKRGYRFVPPVETVVDPSDTDGSAALDEIDPVPGARFQRPRGMRSPMSVWSFAGLAIAAGIMATVMTVSRAADRPAVLSEAEREYLIGRHFWNKIEPAHVERALQRFHRAAALDPDSALAYAGIADSHLLMMQLAMTNRSRSLPTARAAAERAIALDPNLALPHVVLGYVAAMERLDLTSARLKFEHALALEAPIALPAYGSYLTWIGDLDGAREFFARAQQFDPVSAHISTRAARIEYYDGHYGAAIELLREVLEREPSFSLARYYLALSYAFEGHIDAALQELRQAQLNPDLLATDEAWILARRGELHHARALIAERAPGVKAGTRRWNELLMSAIAVGDRDLAIRVLEEMWTTRELELLHLQVDPRFDPLRADVRFQSLSTRVLGDEAARRVRSQRR